MARTIPFTIILLGDPGSGKGTQSTYIAKKYNLYDFDMGRMLRQLGQSGNMKRFEKALEKTIDTGKLAPTQIVRKIHERVILGLNHDTGILFNGTPKMIGEARLVYKLLNETGRINPNVLFLYLHIPHSEVVKRLAKRYEIIDGDQKKRRDDTNTALKNRMKYYKKNIQTVIHFFEDKYPYYVIDGLGSRSDVRKRFVAAIEAFIKHRNV